MTGKVTCHSNGGPCTCTCWQPVIVTVAEWFRLIGMQLVYVPKFQISINFIGLATDSVYNIIIMNCIVLK